MFDLQKNTFKSEYP